MTMTGRERMLTIVAGEKPDRLPIRGVGGWAEAVERWHSEGMPCGASESEALGLVDPDGGIDLPLNLNMVPGFPVRVLEKDERHVLLVDEFGVTKRMMRDDFDRTGGCKVEAGSMSAMSHWLAFPVKDMTSWKQIYEERFQPDVRSRLPVNWGADKAEFIRKAKTRWVSFFCFPFFGLLGPIRELMGFEGVVYAMADDPDLIHTIVDDLTDMWVSVFDQVLHDGVRLDQVMLFEDMCSTRAPLVGPSMFHEFFSPGYRKLISVLRSLGVNLVCVDTDGNGWKIVPELLSTGVRGLSPCEVHAGMEAEPLREAFPELYLQGGIAKGALVLGHEQIDVEVERRFRTAWAYGRYVPSLDHLAPPDISWSNMQHYAGRCLELVDEPA